MRVVKPWMDDLPLRMQSTILLSLRGPDGIQKNGPHKDLIRELRFVALVPAFPRDIFPKADDVFMGQQRGYCDAHVLRQFKDDHDQYPHHWILHLIHAAEIIGQFHPDIPIREFWWIFYMEMCDAMHMVPEDLEQLTARLSDPAWVRVHEGGV